MFSIGNGRFEMKKGPVQRIVLPLILAIIMLSFLPNCTYDSDVRREVTNSLIALNKTGISNADTELSKLDEQRYDTEVKLLKLEQVVSPALKWLQSQKTREFRTGTWTVRVTPEGLTQLKNDQYRVTELEFSIYRADSPSQEISTTLKIADLSTNAIYPWDEMQNNLKSARASFEEQWQARLKQRELALSTLKNLIMYHRIWKVQAINQTTYTISGTALGWADKLTTGAWTYYRDKQELVPADEHARALKKVLLTEF